MRDNANPKGKDRERKDPGPPKEYPRVYSPPIPKISLFGRRTYERPTVERTESLPAYSPSKPPTESTPVKQDSPPEPVKGSELRLVANGNRFSGPIVDCLVGPQNQVFTAHVAVLSQSPRLRCAYPPGVPWRTIQVKRISPRMFGFILEYLYTHTLEVEGWESGADLPMDMALLYIEACAFGLDSLRQLIVSKFETMPALKDNPTLVLQIATEVYPQIPKGDKLFKGFFVKALETCREGPARFPEDYADTLTAKGGDLATDICKAERRRTSVLMAKEARRARRLSYDGLDSQGNRITIYDKSSSEED